MITRRQFFKMVGGAGLAVLAAKYKLIEVIAQIPGGSLDPVDLPKYVTPLLIPPVMPRAGILIGHGGKLVDYYEISTRQFQQQILPAGMPATTVWGYGAVKSISKNGLLLHNAPSLTIEADVNRPVRIKWINDLKDASGGYLPHLLPVDQTLHWANPPGGMDGRDTRPDLAGMPTPGTYTGPVPLVPHVHGAVGVGDESDGYAEAWYLPNANNIPAGYATEGTWYNFFKNKAKSKFRVNWGPGFATFQYPNNQRAATIWYHDHTLGMTRLNVYAGPAGFFIVRGGPAGDAAVTDKRHGRRAILPGPAPSALDTIIPRRRYYEIPLAIQDRSFNTDGSLFYPDTRAFFDEYIGPYIPETDVSPIWNPEFFGNTIIVNGNTWPFQQVEKRRYRFRVLNGCNSRFLILDFNSIPGVKVWQIGNEGGFLSAPVNLTGTNGNRLLMGLAERADLIVDFTAVPVGNYLLRNVGPDEPFKGFNPDGTLADGEGGALPPADPASTGQIMQFNVVRAKSPDLTTPPQFLKLPPIKPLPPETVTRPLALIEEMSTAFDGPVAALLGTVSDGSDPDIPAGVTIKRMWSEAVTENPAVGATEIWEFYNTTADAHPMHIHELVFEVVNRQAIMIEEMPMGEEGMGGVSVMVTPGSTPILPYPWETGFKDTVIAYPGQVTRVKASFDQPGQYVWHCHIVEHEDNEMMRPYRIGPEQPGQPMPHGPHPM